MKKRTFYLSIMMLLVTLNVASYAETKPIITDVVSDAVELKPMPPVLTHLMPAPSKKSSQDIFKLFDIDADNKITFDEYIQGQVLQRKQSAEKEVAKMMLQCDKNKDGAISADELMDEEQLMKSIETGSYGDEDKLSQECLFPKEMMEVLDDNGDNLVSREEMVLTMQTDRRPSKKERKKREKKMLKREADRRVKQFDKCDKDADYMLSMRESFSMNCHLGLFTEQFDAYDSDMDGYLSVDELSTEVKAVTYQPTKSAEEIAMRKKMPPLMRLETSMFECDSDEDGRLGKNETISANCEQDMAFFDRVDNDQDGYISQDEIQRVQSKKSFDRMDKNKDDTLDASEFKSRYGGIY